jgi:hypothetical protein
MDPEDDYIKPLYSLPFRFSALYNRYSAAGQGHQAGRVSRSGTLAYQARLFDRPVESARPSMPPGTFGWIRDLSPVAFSNSTTTYEQQ